MQSNVRPNSPADLFADEQPLRILIADGEAFFRRGIREIINEESGLQVVGEAIDGEKAITLTRQLWSSGLDAVLMAVDVPRVNGFAATEILTSEYPDLAVILLTTNELEAQFINAVRAGAVGYLRRNLEPEALLRALHGFRRGESLPISRAMAESALTVLRARVLHAPPAEQALPTLTPREREVSELIAHGARDREIAARLVLSESTAKKHVQNILRKLQARNRAEAVARLQGSSGWPAPRP
ncbi:MAG TPA: response regulator transcription factor [Chloroflexota bacterium]|nr:response regulator transcription factor [Chloroflexota bacterium]